MNHNIKAVICIFSACMLLTAACRKPKPYATIQNKVTGTWRASQTATDANNNGIADPNEIVPDTSGTTLTLNADGTGSTSFSLLGISLPVPVPLTWQLTDNNTNIKETLTIPYINTTTVVNGHIDDLTANTMTLSTKLATATTWTYYQKL